MAVGAGEVARRRAEAAAVPADGGAALRPSWGHTLAPPSRHARFLLPLHPPASIPPPSRFSAVGSDVQAKGDRMDPSLQEREDGRGERRKKKREREERGEGGGAGENGAEVSVEAAGVASFQLMYLAHEGNAEGVRKPLGAGADPNFRDSGARTVLHISSCEGHAEVVDLLLDRSAEAVVEDQWGSTMNVLLHMELTEYMKIMPSHIMLTKF